MSFKMLKNIIFNENDTEKKKAREKEMQGKSMKQIY